MCYKTRSNIFLDMKLDGFRVHNVPIISNRAFRIYYLVFARFIAGMEGESYAITMALAWIHKGVSNALVTKGGPVLFANMTSQNALLVPAFMVARAPIHPVALTATVHVVGMVTRVNMT